MGTHFFFLVNEVLISKLKKLRFIISQYYYFQTEYLYKCYWAPLI